jgi:DNA polymerase-3 subunit epsilon
VQELSDLDVLIVDCQSTGASPAYGSVLELGWGIAHGTATEIRGLQAHWVALPKGTLVTSQVRKLTGFHESDATDALDPREAWERLRAATNPHSQVPTAIHFARFELAFLRDWADRFDPRSPFPFDTVCVHAIACRLYPDLPRRSIRALAGFLGYSLDLTRRCLGHVEATAFVWRKLTEELRVRGIRTWEELGGWLVESPGVVKRARKRRYPLPSAKYRALPDQPGVYRMVRSNLDVLYVGKATSLRKRVASHFTSRSSITERALEMLTQVHDIVVTPTQTALEAALRENEDIKSLQPPYNVQLLASDSRMWFCDASLESVAPVPGDFHRHGPLPSTFFVRSLGAVTKLASGEPATRSLRARAVTTAERWAPDEGVFADALRTFIARHVGDLRPPRPQRQLDCVAKKLLLAKKDDIAEEPEVEDGGALDAWDHDRVLRHLERGVANGYQLLQRARWLCLLQDSVVAFREPGAPMRVLVLMGGTLIDAKDGAPEEASLPRPAGYPPLLVRQTGFDRNRYDRLRTLTTELKRVLRDGGSAEVRVGRGRWLGTRTLRDLLRWV